MNWFTGIVTFLTTWWIVLFVVLPFGSRSQAEAGEITEGTEPGAPVMPNMRKKVVLTTIITLIVWGSFVGLVATGMISLAHPLGKYGPQ